MSEAAGVYEGTEGGEGKKKKKKKKKRGGSTGNLSELAELGRGPVPLFIFLFRAGAETGKKGREKRKKKGVVKRKEALFAPPTSFTL